MICPNCGQEGAEIRDGKLLLCTACHRHEFVQDPNKVCPLCGDGLRTTNSVHGGGFRTARRACANKDCAYSVVTATFVVSTRLGRGSDAPGYVKVAEMIRDGKMRLVRDE